MLGLGCLTATFGCGFLGDALNPAFLAGIGVDPGTVIPPRGTVIVLFKNETDFAALFHAFEAADALDWTREARNFAVEVPASDSRNEVLSCPVGVFSPGVLSEAFAFEGGTAAEVFTDQDVVAIPYAWPLLNPRDFRCGAVIEVTLTQVATPDAPYSLAVRVIPGR